MGKLLSPGRPIDLGYLINDSIQTFFYYILSKEKAQRADKANKIPQDSNAHPGDFLILDPFGPVHQKQKKTFCLKKKEAFLTTAFRSISMAPSSKDDGETVSENIKIVF